MILFLVKDRRGPDLNRIPAVATILGIQADSIKKLLDSRIGGPWHSAAPATAISGLQGAAYVSTAEIERFLAEYTTLALTARQLGRQVTSDRRELKMAGIVPATGASSLGAGIYRRGDVTAFLASQGTPPSENGNDTPLVAVFGNKTVISG